jgi:hypothetical protein
MGLLNQFTRFTNPFAFYKICLPLTQLLSSKHKPKNTAELSLSTWDAYRHNITYAEDPYSNRSFSDIVESSIRFTLELFHFYDKKTCVQGNVECISLYVGSTKFCGQQNQAS